MYFTLGKEDPREALQITLSWRRPWRSDTLCFCTVRHREITACFKRVVVSCEGDELTLFSGQEPRCRSVKLNIEGRFLPLFGPPLAEEISCLPVVLRYRKSQPFAGRPAGWTGTMLAACFHFRCFWALSECSALSPGNTYESTNDTFGDWIFLALLGLVVSRRAIGGIGMNLPFMGVND